MANKRIVDVVFECAKPIVNGFGFELVDVEYVKKPNGMNLTIYVDNPNGVVNLEDCEKISHALDEPLDILDPTKGEFYYFNVSSMGLDRPITTEYQFNKYKGSEIEIKMYEPLKPYNKKINTETIINLAQPFILHKFRIAQSIPTIIPTWRPETASKWATPDKRNASYWSSKSCALSPNKDEYAISMFSFDKTPLLYNIKKTHRILMLEITVHSGL